MTGAIMEIQRFETATPFLKWAGGKTQLLPHLREHAPAKFGRYFEPFVGGGAFYFDLRRRRHLFDGAVLGDANRHLVRTYKAVKSYTAELIGELSFIEGAYRKCKSESARETFYYAVRSRGFEHNSPVVIAARFIFLNRVGYNGMYRENKRGEFNIPFGRYTNPTICDREGLRKCASALRGTEIRAGDFVATSEDARRGDFVYFDPPYVPRPKEDVPESDFTQYTADGFTLADQTRLRDHALALKKRGVRVLLSNADVPVVRKLYRGFDMVRVSARRNINSKAGGRGPVGEVIIT